VSLVKKIAIPGRRLLGTAAANAEPSPIIRLLAGRN